MFLRCRHSCSTHTSNKPSRSSRPHQLVPPVLICNTPRQPVFVLHIALLDLSRQADNTGVPELFPVLGLCWRHACRVLLVLEGQLLKVLAVCGHPLLLSLLLHLGMLLLVLLLFCLLSSFLCCKPSPVGQGTCACFFVNRARPLAHQGHLGDVKHVQKAVQSDDVYRPALQKKCQALTIVATSYAAQPRKQPLHVRGRVVALLQLPAVLTWLCAFVGGSLQG